MAKRTKAPVAEQVSGKRPKRGSTPEGKLKKFAVAELNQSGLLWWRNQSGFIWVLKGGRKYPMHLGCDGLFDLCLLGNEGKVYFIELKSPKGRVSEDQKTFLARCKKAPDVSGVDNTLPTGYPNPHVRCFIARSGRDICAIIAAAKFGVYINEEEYLK